MTLVEQPPVVGSDRTRQLVLQTLKARGLVSTERLAKDLGLEFETVKRACVELWDHQQVGRVSKPVESWHVIDAKHRKVPPAMAELAGTEKVGIEGVFGEKKRLLASSEDSIVFELRQVTVKELQFLLTTNRIAFPSFQRASDLWNSRRKTQLVDSILQGIDLPKFYFREVEDVLECLDGRQRISTIVSLLSGEMRHSDGRYWEDFSELDRESFLAFSLTFSVVKKATDEQLRQVFVRLQLGLQLSTGEKLQAEKGGMTDFAAKLAESPLFSQSGCNLNRKGAYLMAATLACLTLRRHEDGTFPDTRYPQLRSFIVEFKDFDQASSQAEEISHVVSRMEKAFGVYAADVTHRAELVAAYLLFESKPKESPEQLRDFVLAFSRAMASALDGGGQEGPSRERRLPDAQVLGPDQIGRFERLGDRAEAGDRGELLAEAEGPGARS